MKAIYTIAILILAANLSYAQSTGESQITEEKVLAEAPDAAAHDYSYEHGQAAISQLRVHIVENIVYPERMIENGIEGTVVLAVSIAQDGTIEESKIVKSFSSSFDQAILKTLQTMEAIELDGRPYQGGQTIHFPIQFSLNR